MIILLLGAPGAGKGTHAAKIADYTGLPHVSSGALLRNAVEKGTELGRKAREYMDAGKLVPDEFMLRWIEELLDDPEYEEGIILDGFPRTIPQAKALDEVLEGRDLEVDLVLLLNIEEQAAANRLLSRVSCTKCGAIHNLAQKPMKVDGVCDACGGELETRADDVRETIEKRFETFRRETQPMIEYYRHRGNFWVVNTDRAVEEVEQDVREVVDGAREREAARKSDRS
jgi:adenylate kinase